jgi:hypothetical protein
MDNIKEILTKKAKGLNFVKSINIIGSCAYDAQNKDRHKEIDFYVVVEKLTPGILSEMTDLFGSLRKLYPNMFIELRRGPFKNKSAKQIHLIIDDYESIRYTSDITLNDWALNSLNIYGGPISKLVPRITNNSLKKSFNEELSKTINMVTNRKIFYKEWSSKNGSLMLYNKEKGVSSLYEYLVLLKYAYTAMRNDWISLHNLKTSNSDIIFDGEQELLPLRKLQLTDCYKVQFLTSNVLSFNLGLIEQLGLSH